MSLADFSEADLDRLADHLAGALDPRAAAEVGRLIRTDQAWAGAATELGGAEPAVRAQLQAYGRSSNEPMPEGVISRVEAALAAVAGADRPRAGGTVMGVSRASSGGASISRPAPAPRVPAEVIPIAAARRARRRWLAGLAAAAVALVTVGTGVVISRDASVSTPTAGGRADTALSPQSGTAGGSAAVPSLRLPGGVPVTSSGTDYTPASLAASARSSGPSVPAPTVSAPVQAPGAAAPGSDQNGSNDKSLQRLSATDALQNCLDQIMAAHPGQVLSVDYARYESAPAIIVVIRQSTGTIAVAAGAACGVAGPDELATAA